MLNGSADIDQAEGKRYAAAFLPAQITSDYLEVYQQVLATTRPWRWTRKTPHAGQRRPRLVAQRGCWDIAGRTAASTSVRWPS